MHPRLLNGLRTLAVLLLLVGLLESLSMAGPPWIFAPLLPAFWLFGHALWHVARP